MFSNEVSYLNDILEAELPIEERLVAGDVRFDSAVEIHFSVHTWLCVSTI